VAFRKKKLKKISITSYHVMTNSKRGRYNIYKNIQWVGNNYQFNNFFRKLQLFTVILYIEYLTSKNQNQFYQIWVLCKNYRFSSYY